MQTSNLIDRPGMRADVLKMAERARLASDMSWLLKLYADYSSQTAFRRECQAFAAELTAEEEI